MQNWRERVAMLSPAPWPSLLSFGFDLGDLDDFIREYSLGEVLDDDMRLTGILLVMCQQHPDTVSDCKMATVNYFVCLIVICLYSHNFLSRTLS